MILRSQFDNEYQQLCIRLLDMKMICLSQLELMEKQLKKPKKTRFQDMENLRIQAEAIGKDCRSACRQTLLLQHPVAGDMRKMTAIDNAFFDLERISSMLAEAFSQLYLEDLYFEQEQMLTLCHTASTMLQNSLNHFTKKEAPVFSVVAMDDIADEGYDALMESSIAALQKTPARAQSIVHILLAAKYLERICDHCVSIARWSQFGS